MKIISPRSLVLAVLFFLVSMPAAFAQGRFQMAYISDSASSSVPYWVAKEVGIFKKYGVDLDLIFINGSTRGIQSLIAGDLDFTGAVGTSAINGKLAGGDIYIIDSMVNTLPYYLIGKPDIKSPEDLKGRSAATHIPGTSADFALRLALRRFGIKYTDIKAVTVGGSPARIAAVMSGQVDFTIVTEPGRIRGEKAGLRTILNMAKLNIPFQFTCTVTTGEMIREHPDQVLNMVKAMADAIHYYKNHKEEVIQIMKKYTRGQKRSVLEGAYNAYSQLYVEDTYPTMEGLQDTLDVQAEFDPKAAKAKAEDFVDLRFVKEMKKSGFIDKLYGRHQMGKN
jgi:NitT/TauT family transport system substrate-binding protein